DLDGRERGLEAQHNARLAVLQRLFVVGFGQRGQHAAIHARRRFDDEGQDVPIVGLVEVGQPLGRMFVLHHLRGDLEFVLVARVGAEIEVLPVGDAFQFLPADGELVEDVYRALGVVRAIRLRHFVELQVLPFQPDLLDPPVQVILDPLLVHRFGVFRVDEVFDLHLLQFAHAENEVPGRDLVAEGLADLRDAEGQLAVRGVQDVLEVDEHALRGFGAQIGERIGVGDGADLRFEHHVEGTGFGQFALALAGMLLGMLEAGRLAQLVGAEATFAGLAVHERVYERLFMAGVFPDVAVHQDGRVYAFHVVALVDVVLPPEALEVVLEFDAERAVVEGSLQSAVDFTAGKDEAAPLAERHQLFHVLSGHKCSQVPLLHEIVYFTPSAGAAFARPLPRKNRGGLGGRARGYAADVGGSGTDAVLPVGDRRQEIEDEVEGLRTEAIGDANLHTVQIAQDSELRVVGAR